MKRYMVCIYNIGVCVGRVVGRRWVNVVLGLYSSTFSLSGGF